MSTCVLFPSTGRHTGAPRATSAAPHPLTAPTCSAHTAATSPCRFCRRPCHPLPHRCQIVPLLPPITPHVKLPNRPTRLEFPPRADPRLAHNLKSGKNGNVDHPSQLSLSALSLFSPFSPSVPPHWFSSRFSFLCALRVLCGSSLSPPPCASVSSVVVLHPPGWRARIPAHIMGDAARRSARGEESRRPVNITHEVTHI
jgi:hypothetical protein